MPDVSAVAASSAAWQPREEGSDEESEEESEEEFLHGLDARAGWTDDEDQVEPVPEAARAAAASALSADSQWIPLNPSWSQALPIGNTSISSGADGNMYVLRNPNDLTVWETRMLSSTEALCKELTTKAKVSQLGEVNPLRPSPGARNTGVAKRMEQREMCLRGKQKAVEKAMAQLQNAIKEYAAAQAEYDIKLAWAKEAEAARTSEIERECNDKRAQKAAVHKRK